MKIAVSFANIFMADKKVIQQSETEPKEWKRYINDVFSFWDCDRKEVNRFVKRANYFHPTIKFAAEISENQPNPFSRYHGVQRGRIRKKFRLGHQNSLEADRDFLNYALRLVPPTRIHHQPFLNTNLTKPPIIFYKKEKLFRTVLWKQKYNLKAVMRHDHESHMGSPCWSIFTLILTSCRCNLSLVSTFLSSLQSILIRKKTYF